MTLLFRLDNGTLVFNNGKGRRDIREEHAQRFREWARRYGQALTSGNLGEFLPMGQEIFAWLDEDSWLGHALEHGTGPLDLEFAVPPNPNETEQAFLHVPWELLANKGGYLARDAVRLFVPTRRLGRLDVVWQPQYADIHLVFMAAAPRHVSTLSYEMEETGIMEQTRRLPLALTVEESGCLTQLGEVVSALPAPPEVVHLSCHGDIKKTKPYLLLEDDEGNQHAVTAGDLIGGLGHLPPLVFLSACRTAEGRTVSSSLAMEMVRGGCANVVGWDGSVNDLDASVFAGHLYKGLARSETVGRAVATARQALLHEHDKDPKKFQHWHLARLVMGPVGGGAVCMASRGKRPLPRNLGKREFLDENRPLVPVAKREHFVGRRRTIQQIIAACRAGEKRGAVIHGIGCVGKSSLAARLANRFSNYQTVLIFQHYDAVAVFDAVVGGLPATAQVEIQDAWRTRIQQNTKYLGNALRAILEGPCCRHDAAAGTKPLLLIVDDLERVLEKADGNRSATPFKTDFQSVMQAILEAFRDVDSHSWVIFTSRYRFTLKSSNGQELADLLLDVPLSGLSEPERYKQWEAESRQTAPGESNDLKKRILAVSHGNPGLQNLLTRLVLDKGLFDAEKAVQQVEQYLASGKIPHSEHFGDFFKRMALESYATALNDTQRHAFRALTLFQLPAPLDAADAVLRVSQLQNDSLVGCAKTGV